MAAADKRFYVSSGVLGVCRRDRTVVQVNLKAMRLHILMFGLRVPSGFRLLKDVGEIVMSPGKGSQGQQACAPNEQIHQHTDSP
jgi:hypothetical protein